MAIYGNQLAFFPELLRDYEVFDMEAKIGGGYGPRKNIRKITGYLSRWKNAGMEVQGDLRTENERIMLWVVDGGDVSISQGEYLENSGQLYVIYHDDKAVREGGFSLYELQIMAGVTDKQVRNRDVDKNIRTDYE